MKTIIFLTVSVLLKKWYEKEKEKLQPVMIARNVEYPSRINYRPRVDIKG
jgi:hypothetical protein